MKNFFLFALFAVLLLALPDSVSAQTYQLIHKIIITNTGPAAVSDAFVLANIRSKVGDHLLRATLQQDEASLWATGFFYHVQVDQNTTPDGIDLYFVLQGKPIVTDIRIIGNKKLSLSKLKKKLTSKTGQPLDELKLLHDQQAMKDLYEKYGYEDTTVTVQPLAIDAAAGRATVTIEIHETPKIKITDVVFDGATAFKQKQLRKVLKTRRHWMFSWLTGSGVLKKEEFEDDQDRLIEYYQNAGYIDFVIKDIKKVYPTPNTMIIHFIISEGRQYKVGTLDIKGNTLFTTNDFIKGMVIDQKLLKLTNVPGAIFTPVAYDGDIETLRDMYGSRGYLPLNEGGTTSITPTRTPNTATGTMDIAFDIQEGDRCYVEKIEIKGNEKTKDRVIRRELAVFPGEVYDMVRIKISKEKLENMEYFTKVDTQAEDTDIPNHKNLIIGLEEGSMSTATVGAGFSSVESIVGFVEVKMKNFDLFDPPTFTGAGQKLQLLASLGTLYQDYEISFYEPYLLGGSRRLGFGVDLFHKEVDYDSLNSMYDETYDGGTVTLTRGINKYLSASLSYTLEAAHLSINSGFSTNSTTNLVGNANGLSSAANVSPPNISTNIYDEHGTDLINKFALTLTTDSRRAIRDPDSGQHSTFQVQVATPPGDTEFYKMELKTSWYYKGFEPGHLIQIDGQAGVADTYGGTSHIPIFERFFLGGLYSLRGYRFREIGPSDQFGEPLGGDTYFFGDAEYSIPIAKPVRIAWFYDIGNVFANPFSFKLTGSQQHFYSDDVGIGLRIVLPVGGPQGMPLRLDYGIPLTHDSNVGSGGRFQIGVGYTRDF